MSSNAARVRGSGVAVPDGWRQVWTADWVWKEWMMKELHDVSKILNMYPVSHTNVR